MQLNLSMIHNILYIMSAFVLCLHACSTAHYLSILFGIFGPPVPTTYIFYLPTYCITLLEDCSQLWYQRGILLLV